MVVKVAPAGDEATTKNLNTENGAIVQQPGIEPGTNIPNPGNVGPTHGPRDFGTYRIIENRKFKRVCLFAHTRQSLRCSHTQTLDVDEDSGKT